MGRKRLARVFIFLVFFINGFGCQQRTDVESPRSPYAGLSLTIACPNERIAKLVQAAGKSWEGRHGAQIDVHVSDPEAFIKHLARVPADLVVGPPSDLPQAVASSALLPLPSIYCARGSFFDWDGLIPLYRDSLLTWGSGEDTSLRLGTANTWRSTCLRFSHGCLRRSTTWDLGSGSQSCASRSSGTTIGSASSRR